MSLLSAVVEFFKNVNFLSSDQDETIIPSLLFDKLGNPAPEVLKVAACIAMIHTAKSDNEFSDSEFNEIQTSIIYHFAIEPEEFKKIVDIISNKIEDPIKINKLFRILKNNYDEDQLTLVLSLVWKVILSDGRIQKKETQVFELLTEYLDLDSTHIEEAKALAKI